MRTVANVVACVGCSILLGGCGTSVPESDEAPAAATAHAKPSRAPQPDPGVVGAVQGEWEDGDLLGEPIEIGDRTLPYAEMLYAARRADVTYVAAGVRSGSRTLRTIQMLTPETEEAADGIDLYGGYVLGDRGPDDRVREGSYLLVGSVPGDVEVAVVQPDGASRPVTAMSTSTLPGYTVFYDTAGWDQDWDQVQAAPLTVTTSDGRTVSVRKRSWTG